MTSQWLHLLQPPGSGPNTLSVSRPPQRWHWPHSFLPSLAGATKSSHTVLGPQPGCTHPGARAAGTALRGSELGMSPASLGVPSRAALVVAQEIDFPGSSPFSSPLVLSLAKESHLGWWCALLFTLKCSHLPPGIVGHIFTFSRIQRVVWSPSPRGFPAVLCSSPQSLGVCPSVQGICRSWESSQGCKSALQSFNLVFGLPWVKFKGILALHVGWVGGGAEEQVVKGWQRGPAPGSSSAKGHSTCRALGKKAISS